VKAFSLTNAARLPLTGELHPLRREFAKWVGAGNATSLLIAFVIFGSWYLWSHRTIEEETMPPGVQIVKFTEMGVPPSISRTQQQQASQVNVTGAAAAPTIGIPEPVPDEQAQTTTIATQAEMSDALAPITASELSGGADSIVVDYKEDNSPRPGDFVAFDELPVLLSAEQPAYPDLAREAGITGTVRVNVLVGKDGRVKKAIAMDGPELFRPAAVEAAQKARFKPALQGRNPVEVWVLIPFNFELNR
jgi:periplasmic protein TonB